MRKPIIITVAAVILLFIIFIAWQLGHKSGQQSGSSTSTTSTAPSQSPSPAPSASSEADKSAVKSTADYTLPDGWKEASCSSKPEAVYLLPPGVSINCDANPSAPISLTVDPNHTSDCNQLADNQNVTKHICKSQDINGKKSLQASTTYTQSSSVSPGMTVSDYYIPAGPQVIKVEYTYSGDATYQAEFDQIAQSVKGKE